MEDGGWTIALVTFPSSTLDPPSSIFLPEGMARRLRPSPRRDTIFPLPALGKCPLASYLFRPVSGPELFQYATDRDP